ncbi:hypothetical protein ABAC460_09435 [Asticcacaulis sp. AC460]|uniref:class I SAM-dependent methyltransferase n=1 Tax=Asticcacaulis sp. AC460 TaxID=1282360 RepID=UPI0003C3F801|nr:class I SAM-dependent methyltransferase [Asticcacaulis sp. AC460]ESQ90367.1 hypothetical protein ABAC460_09435 [Asticcacaulis sp. AC460]
MDGPPADISQQTVTGLEALIGGIFDDGQELVLDGDLYREIAPFVGQVSTAPVSPEQLAERFSRSHQALYDTAPTVLDYHYGGDGQRAILEHFGFVRQAFNTGSFDLGEQAPLPYDDASFDAVYAFHAFRYERSPDLAFAEIARVLKPNGILLGAVGHLEQVHHNALYNFTPLGLKRLALQAGLRLEEIHPAYDVFSWMLHRLRVMTTTRHDLQDLIRRDNFFHDQCAAYGLRLGRTPAEINLLQLMLSAHITFLIRKPG